ncbi:hypothetical protein [Bordetella sp. LUAb4]|uniref:hypothetical protein n=1 Tax=Bordetella sp. LUAb4 TaxID=2843195 RepID=UPI001E376AD0|nr:hypothetical protein [Bordetella sp. LUAb4]
MMNLFSWLTCLGICLYVFAHRGDTPPGLLAGYVLFALSLRWWLVRRISHVRASNAHLARSFELSRKYRDHRIVEAILSEKIWKGATAEMLLDSWGPPSEVKQGGDYDVWCYGRVGENRFRHRVTMKLNRVKTWTNRN